MLFNLLCMYTKSFMIPQAPKATNANSLLFLVKKKGTYMYIDSFFIILFNYSINLYVFLRDRYHAHVRFHAPGYCHVHVHFGYRIDGFRPMNVRALHYARWQMNTRYHRGDCHG